jgi:hypothetical protein
MRPRPHTYSSRPVRLRRRHGVLAPVDAGFWWELWRDPNHLLLAAPWPVFLAMITLAYLAINLTFAGLYLLFADGIGGVEGGGPATFADAFFFSVQTLGSIGYGVLHPTSLPVNILVSVQALLGLLFIALTTGLAFLPVLPHRRPHPFLQPGHGGYLQRLAHIDVSPGQRTAQFHPGWAPQAVSGPRRIQQRGRSDAQPDSDGLETGGGHRVHADVDGHASDR